MAFAALNSGNAVVLGNNKASSNSLASLVAAATVPAGSLVIVIVAKDNVQTTDGQTNEVTSVTDSTGANTYIKAIEFCNGQGGAGSGATVCIYYCVLTTGYTLSTTTVTANFSSSITAKGLKVLAFSKGATTTIGVAGTNTLATDAADPGAITSSGLSNGTEYLTARGTALENDANGPAQTNTSGWSGAWNNTAGTTGGSNVTNMATAAEFIIASTNTSLSSDFAIVSCDSASVIASFYEISPPNPIFFERQQQLHYMRN